MGDGVVIVVVFFFFFQFFIICICELSGIEFPYILEVEYFVLAFSNFKAVTIRTL